MLSERPKEAWNPQVTSHKKSPTTTGNEAGGLECFQFQNGLVTDYSQPRFCSLG